MEFVRARACWRLLILCAGLLLVASGTARASSHDRSIAQLHHTAWSARSGAPSQASALEQTRDGFLWIGTARGLYRFDGMRFEQYRGDAATRLPSENIYDLLASRDGGLWIALRPSGLAYLRDGKLQVFTKPGQQPKTWVYELVEDQQGRIWAATHGGLAMRRGSTWVDVDKDWGLPRTRIRSLLVCRNGDLWVATDVAVYRLPAQGARFERIAETPTSVARMVEGRDGRIWLAEVSFTLRWIDPKSRHFGVFPRQLPDNFQDFIMDSRGALWGTTMGSGLIRIAQSESRPAGDQAPLDLYAQEQGLTSNDGGQLLEDVEGNIWVSTLKGLNRFRASALVSVALPPGHQNLSLRADPDGRLWVASARQSSPVVIDARVKHGLEVARQLDVASIATGSVFADARLPGDPEVWWGGLGQIAKQQGGNFRIFARPTSLPSDWAWAVTAGPDPGTILVGYGDDGMWQVDAAGNWQRAILPPGMLPTVPSATWQAPSGRLWLGYKEDRATYIESGQVHSFSHADGLDIGRIKVIRGAGEHVWFGGETGLAIFHRGRFHRVASTEGKSGFGAVAGIIEARGGDVWLAELGGVVRIPASEVQALLARPEHAVAFRRFDYEDGLPGAPQMNWTSSTAVETRDGSLWFATDNGLAWLDPKAIPRNLRPPPVVLRSLVADGVSYPPRDQLQLPIGTENVRIAYTALSLTVPERVQFKYRLEGYDAAWQIAGGRREAAYTHLGPGEYRFQLMASNNDGVWNIQGTDLNFTVQPAFYQTRWFILLAVLVGLGFGYLMFLMRMHQIRRRLASHLNERHRERERIARDLHDTLLQSVQGLILRFQAVARLIPQGQESRAQLEQALDEADVVLDDSRDRLSDLRSNAPSPVDIASALSRTAALLSTEIEFALSGNADRELVPAVHEEVFRIAREAIINAFRHSGGTRVECDIECREGELVVTVRDNGIGFDVQWPERAGLPGHWGLHGMRERAEAIGATLDFRRRDGGGFEVQLRLAGRLAYASQASRGPWYRRLWQQDTED